MQQMSELEHVLSKTHELFLLINESLKNDTNDAALLIGNTLKGILPKFSAIDIDQPSPIQKRICEFLASLDTIISNFIAPYKRAFSTLRLIIFQEILSCYISNEQKIDEFKFKLLIHLNSKMVGDYLNQALSTSFIPLSNNNNILPFEKLLRFFNEYTSGNNGKNSGVTSQQILQQLSPSNQNPNPLKPEHEIKKIKNEHFMENIDSLFDNNIFSSITFESTLNTLIDFGPDEETLRKAAEKLKAKITQNISSPKNARLIYSMGKLSPTTLLGYFDDLNTEHQRLVCDSSFQSITNALKETLTKTLTNEGFNSRSKTFSKIKQLSLKPNDPIQNYGLLFGELNKVFEETQSQLAGDHTIPIL